VFASNSITISVNKDEKVDLITARLISLFDNKKPSIYTHSIKEKNSNFISLEKNLTDFAIVKGNQAYEAHKTMPNLRSIAALYPELLTFVVQKDSNIKSLSDKNIKIAYVGEDTKEILTYIYKKLDLNISSLIKLEQNQTTTMLQNGSIDGYIGLFAHPSDILKEQSEKTDIKLINLRAKAYNQLIRSNSFFLKSRINKDIYNIQDHDIETIGVKTLLITTKECDEKKVFEITKTILDNIDKFKKLDPIYKNLSKKDLLEELVLPQHTGAIKAFNDMRKSEKL
jgi:TRAP transporter TAXI family solute receptor